MKKSGILLLTALTLGLTSCGTTYLHKSNENAKLQLGSSTFTLSETVEDETINILIARYTYSKTEVFKGTVEQKEDKENVYILTVTSVTAQYEVDGDYADIVLEAVLPSYWTKGEVDQLVAGEKVSKKLNEGDYFKLTVSVDETYKTWTYTL